MRSIQVEKVRDAVRDMCIEANYSLSPDMRCVFEKACQEEKSPLGRQILNQLSENLEIAKKDEIPICQDTGMAVVFLEVGQESVLVIQKDTFGNPLLEIPFCESIPGTIHPACSIMKLCPETA